jgi:cell division septation protein DedD
MSPIFVCVALIRAEKIRELIQRLRSTRIEARISTSMRIMRPFALLGEALR